jgi:hypothetical protein
LKTFWRSVDCQLLPAEQHVPIYEINEGLNPGGRPKSLLAEIHVSIGMVVCALSTRVQNTKSFGVALGIDEKTWRLPVLHWQTTRDFTVEKALRCGACEKILCNFCMTTCAVDSYVISQRYSFPSIVQVGHPRIKHGFGSKNA